MSLTRYQVGCGARIGMMLEHVEGAWVRWDDHEQELAALRGRLAEVEGVGRRMADTIAELMDKAARFEAAAIQQTEHKQAAQDLYTAAIGEKQALEAELARLREQLADEDTM